MNFSYEAFCLEISSNNAKNDSTNLSITGDLGRTMSHSDTFILAFSHGDLLSLCMYISYNTH